MECSGWPVPGLRRGYMLCGRMMQVRNGGLRSGKEEPDGAETCGAERRLGSPTTKSGEQGGRDWEDMGGRVAGLGRSGGNVVVFGKPGGQASSNGMASEPGEPPSPPQRLHPAGVTYGN